MLTKWIYTKLVQYLPLSPAYPLNSFLIRAAEKLFGHAVFNYGGIKMTAGPYALLDRYIIRGRNINPYATSAIAQYLNEGGVFLDIGAHHGVFSLLAAKNPRTKVFAFEPSPRELKRLWKNLHLNGKHNISVLSFGLGEEEKEQVLHLSGDHNPGMNSLPSVCPEGKRIQCYFTSLLQLMSPALLAQARVCKMDVEGQELFILNSLRSHMTLLKQCVFVVEINLPLLHRLNISADEIYDFFHHANFVFQFGKPDHLSQWEEFFYHPDYCQPLEFSAELR